MRASTPSSWRAEQVDAAVGQARGEERDELAVGGVRVAERDSGSRRARRARAVVELAIEPLEGLVSAGVAGTWERLTRVHSHARRCHLQRSLVATLVARDMRCDVGIVGLGVDRPGSVRAAACGEGSCHGLRPRRRHARGDSGPEAFLAGLRRSPPLRALDDLDRGAPTWSSRPPPRRSWRVRARPLGAGRDLMVLSCGGAPRPLDDWVAPRREQAAAASWCRPGRSPASTASRARAIGAVTAVTMETRKPPRGLAGAPVDRRAAGSTSTPSRGDADLRGPGHRRRAGPFPPMSTSWPRCPWPASARSARASGSTPCPA